MCPRQPRRTMSAAAIRHSWVFVRSCSRMMRSMRSAGVCRMSRNENIPALFTSTSMAAPSRRTASHSSAAASMRARSISTIRTSGRNPAAGDAAFRTPPSGPAPAASISLHTVSSGSQGVTASDARPGSRDQRPGASRGDGSPPADAAAASGNGCGRGAALPARCDCFAFHHGRRLSSSTIRRGRLSQCLQHFMSTEYIRAMQ